MVHVVTGMGAVGVVPSIVQAGVVKVMVAAGVMVVAETKSAEQELAHQERAAHNRAN
jgi:hypothetical protein